MKKGLLVLLALSILFTGCQQKEETMIASNPRNTLGSLTISVNNDDIQATINEIAKKYNAMGVQVAIVNNGIMAGSYTYGWATKDVDEMTKDHKMRVASISKIFIGLATMFLYDEGIIDIDEGIGKYWNTTVRNPSFPNTPITIRHILTHTSSFIAYGDGYSTDYDSVRNRFGNCYTSSKPGDMSGRYYNNYAFSTLGMTLELASGNTLDEILNQNLFDAMDIDASFASGDIEATDKLVTLYKEAEEVTRTIEEQLEIHMQAPGSEGKHYAGGLTISSVDLAKIVMLLVNDGNYCGKQLISSKSIELMETYNPESLPNGSNQALPLYYDDNMYGRDSIYFHSGSTHGTYNCFSYDPQTKDGVVILSIGANKELDKYDMGMICTEINDYLYGVIK